MNWRGNWSSGTTYAINDGVFDTTSGSSYIATAASTNQQPPNGSYWNLLAQKGANGSGSGTVSSVALTAPAFLSVSGSPITSTGTLALSYSGTALPVANGGTGVTASTGANSVVLRDANQNITANSISEGYSNVAAAGTTTVLTVTSAPNYVVTGSGGQTYQLPDATTLQNGANFVFNNNQTSGTIVVKNNSSTTVATIQAGGYVEVVLLSNATSAGSWDVHNQAPSNVSWSTNTFDYPGSITSATWNGTTVAINRGGTGATTAQTAINALAGGVTSGSYLRGNGTNVVLSTIQAADVPTLNQNTTGTASNVTGTVAVANGGTGLTTSPANGALDIGNGSGFTRTTLTAGSGVTITNGSGSITIAASGSTATATTVSDTANTSTGYFQLPQGTTAQRPGSPANGMLRVNNTNNSVEFYSTVNNSWNLIYSIPTATSAIELLVVAAGGGGGDSSYYGGRCGAGGAGGLLYYGPETPKTPNGSEISVSAGTTYTVTVGAAANVRNPSYTAQGGNSSFNSYVATGGGGGGYTDGSSGGSGGSGGGGWYGGAGGTSTSGQGNDGGAGSTASRYGGGGGGGSGSAGVIGNTITGGNGGNGLQYVISGSSTYYAGGGSSDVWPGTGGVSSPGTPGLGGGGIGNNFAGAGGGGAGTANTGGGGGSNGYGGSGIVILRYPDTYLAATSTTGSPTITVAGGYRVYKFFSSGSITF
jgi:hypothetical protein